MSVVQQKGAHSKKAVKLLNNQTALQPAAGETVTLTIKETDKDIKDVQPVAKQRKMDHYLLTTKSIASAADNDEDDNDAMSNVEFILSDNNNEVVGAERSGEIREVVDLSEDDLDNKNKTKELCEHVCAKCLRSFRRVSSLKKHLDFCRFDREFESRKAEMLKSIAKIEKEASSMENKDICFCCEENYDTCHLGHISCPDCPKSFKTQKSYERHVFLLHSELSDFPCSVCNAKLRTAALLKLHEEQHQNRGKPFACKVCGKDFTRSYHLKRHQKFSSCGATDSAVLSCKVCDRSFFRLDNLRAHLKTHLGTVTTKKSEYTCPYCNNCFYSMSTLNIHTRTHTGERPFDCDLCEKKFPSLVALKKHRRYHTGEKPYQCTKCNTFFAVKEVLNRHMKRHTNDRPHVCNECGKRFIQATQLRSHVRTHLRPHACATCEEKFKTEKQLLRHVAKHNTKRKRRSTKKTSKSLRTVCSVCKLKFDTNASLKFHVLKEHDGIEADEEGVEMQTSTADADASAFPTGIFEIIEVNNGIDSAISTTSPKDIKKQNAAKLNGAVVLQELIINEIPQHVIDLNKDNYTIIPTVVEQTEDNETIVPDAIKKLTAKSKIKLATDQTDTQTQRKSLAASLAAAIATDEMLEESEDAEDANAINQMKNNVAKLLDMLVDEVTLKKFGWPRATEENVLCKVIENCGHNMDPTVKELAKSDYLTRMREYIKLLFTVVIQNDRIKDLLNNFPIDEVMKYVLGSDEEEDEEEFEDDVTCEDAK